MSANLIVACGGSGIYTAIEALERMAGDPLWRYRLNTEVAFLLIDMTRKDMDDFTTRFNRALETVADKPVLETLHLSANHSSYQKVANETFARVNAMDDATHSKRVTEHWWHQNEEAVVPKIRGPITAGAAKLPLASYFMTWKNSNLVQSSVVNVLDQLQRRRDGDLSIMNVLLIAGLSGGTGRGIWQFVGLNIRQSLQKRKQGSTFVSMLFDSTVHQDRMGAFSPSHQAILKGNSLTGFSEVSAWTANQDRSRPTMPCLPHLSSPGNQQSDVIRIDASNDPVLAGPCNANYFVFGDNPRVRLPKTENYYAMAGTALYGMVTQSHVGNQAINHEVPYFGVAAASVEVQSEQLNDYFQAVIRQNVLRNLRRDHANVARRALVEFQRGCQLGTETSDKRFETFKAARPLRKEDFIADENGHFIQKICHAIESHTTHVQLQSELAHAFSEDDPELVKDAVVQFDTKRQQVIKEVVGTFVSNIQVEIEDTMKLRNTPEATQLATIIEKHLDTVFDRAKSFASGLSYLNALDEYLQSLRETLRTTPTIGGQPLVRNDLEQLVDQYKSATFFIGERFSDAEEDSIREACQDNFLIANEELIRTELVAVIDDALQQLQALTKRLKTFLESLHIAEGFYAERVAASLKGDGGGKTLFANLEKIEDAVYSAIDTDRFFHRVLRPVKSEAELEQLTAELLSQQSFADLLLDVLRPLSEVDPPDSALEQRTLKATTADSIKRAAQRHCRMPDDFVETHFDLESVLCELTRKWCIRISEATNRSEREKLLNLFDATLGYRPDFDDGQQVFLPMAPTESMERLATDIAKNCQPHWRINVDEEKKPPQITYLFFRSSEQIHSTKVESQNLTITYPLHAAQRHMEANPFVMLAYAYTPVERLEQIESLQYYATADMHPLMQQAEANPSKTWDDHRFGLISPIFKDADGLDRGRWKPWLDQDAEAQVLQNNRAVDAMLYGLFPGDSLSVDESVQALLNALKGKGWQHPLVRMKSGNRFVLTRGPVRFDEKAGKTIAIPPTGNSEGWDTEAAFDQHAGFARAMQSLKSGDRRAWVDPMLEEAKQLFENLLPTLGFGPKANQLKQVFEVYQTWILLQLSRESDDVAKEAWQSMADRYEGWRNELTR